MVRPLSRVSSTLMLSLAFGYLMFIVTFWPSQLKLPLREVCSMSMPDRFRRIGS